MQVEAAPYVLSFGGLMQLLQAKQKFKSSWILLSKIYDISTNIEEPDTTTLLLGETNYLLVSFKSLKILPMLIIVT